MLRALVWDVDGTLAETERDGHRVAFNQAFDELGLRWHWSVARYGELLAVSGGRQRLLHDMATRADAPRSAAAREALAAELHRRKNAAYAAQVAGGAVALRPGVRRLIGEATAAGARLAIATTTSRANVEAMLAREFGSGTFAAIVCAEDAPALKPHPQVYLQALQRLALAPPEVVAIEDSPNGLASACAAGIGVLVAHSEYFADFDTAAALGRCRHLDDEVQPGAAAAAAGVAPAPRVDWPWLCQARAACQNRQPRPTEV